MQKIDVKKLHGHGGNKFHRPRDPLMVVMGLTILLVLCSTRGLHEEARPFLASLLSLGI